MCQSQPSKAVRVCQDPAVQMTDGLPGREIFLGRDDRLDELLWGGSVYERLAIGGVLENFAESADNLEIIARIRFWGAEHKYEFYCLVAVLKVDTGGAAARSHDDFFNVLGAGVRKDDLLAETGGVEAFAGEQLVVESLKIRDVRVSVEQTGNFVKRDRAIGALHVQRDTGWVEEYGKTASHAGEGCRLTEAERNLMP